MSLFYHHQFHYCYLLFFAIAIFIGIIYYCHKLYYLVVFYRHCFIYEQFLLPLSVFIAIIYILLL